MKIFNRVKSALNRYLSRYEKQWVFLHIGWVFLMLQICTMPLHSYIDLLFMVCAVACFTASMLSEPKTYFRHAKD